jgi:hypothetical protein
MFKTAFITGVIVACCVMASSCNKSPFACFTTDVNADSIRVGHPVTFNAGCSENAGDYDWKFYNNDDSIFFGRTITKTFKDTGTVNVYLLIVGGNKTTSTSQDFRVNP